jgi:DNA ligase-1
MEPARRFWRCGIPCKIKVSDRSFPINLEIDHSGYRIRTLFASQPVTLLSLYNNLVTLTALKGSGTVNKKADIIQRMLVAAKGEEVRFLVRTLVAHLRIGAVRLTVTASLARAFCLIAPVKADEADEFYISPEEREGVKAVAKTVKEGKDDPRRLVLMGRLAKAEALVREVYVRHPNYDNIVPALLNVGLQGLSEAIPLQVGTPLSPMLGQITRDLGDVSKRLEPSREFAAEWKYDGQRVQIHCERRKRGSVPAGESKISSKKGGGQWVEGTDVYVRLFSRHLEVCVSLSGHASLLMSDLVRT